MRAPLKKGHLRLISVIDKPILALFPFLVALSFFYCPPSHAAIDNLVRENSIAVNLAAPSAIAIDSSGGIYVSESGKNRLLVFSPEGVYLNQLTGLDKPLGVAVGANGRIYVCNSGRKNVEVYGSGLNLLFRLGAGNGEFDLPVGVALGITGNIYVADAKASIVKVYLADGTYGFSFGGEGNDDGRFNYPTSISIDRITEDVIVSDLQVTLTGIRGARIQVFDKNGTFKRKFGSFGQGEGLLTKPVGTAVDTNGRIYVSDAYQHIVEVFDSGGAYIKTVYDASRPMRTPLGIAVDDSAGKLYVASLNSSTVEVYGSGAVSGSGTLTFSGSGGGGGCSVVGGSCSSSVSTAGYLLPLLGLVLYLKARRKPEKTN
ncbi:MAG: NHL repeat-containing protein [Deltaproteobacteria bacterium]|nr:NHL repeat-containing protein [Deltaproteobacteria bacterium]